MCSVVRPLCFDRNVGAVVLGWQVHKKAIENFYEKAKGNDLVLCKWFAVQVCSPAFNMPTPPPHLSDPNTTPIAKQTPNPRPPNGRTFKFAWS